MNDEWREGREAGFFHSFFWRRTLIVEKLTPHPRYAPGKTSSGVLPSRAIKIEKIKNATGVDACTRISPILPIITLAVSSAASRYGNAMLDPATNARIAHYKSSFYRCNQSLSFWWIDVEEQEYILCFSFFSFYLFFFFLSHFDENATARMCTYSSRERIVNILLLQSSGVIITIAKSNYSQVIHNESLILKRAPLY